MTTKILSSGSGLALSGYGGAGTIDLLFVRSGGHRLGSALLSAALLSAAPDIAELTKVIQR